MSGMDSPLEEEGEGCWSCSSRTSLIVMTTSAFPFLVEDFELRVI